MVSLPNHVCAELEQMLVALRTDLDERLARIKSHYRRTVPPDRFEQAGERNNDDVVIALDVHSDKELRRVEQALARLRHGSYGACECCTRPIELARLYAIPFVERCADCADD
ncbi:MAG: TraR/DksA C4-type zinc finger protein [Pseudomonadota bacterium]